MRAYLSSTHISFEDMTPFLVQSRCCMSMCDDLPFWRVCSPAYRVVASLLVMDLLHEKSIKQCTCEACREGLKGKSSDPSVQGYFEDYDTTHHAQFGPGARNKLREPSPSRCHCECEMDRENRPPVREGWCDLAEKLHQHDEAMAKCWKEDIDSLLVFAGLFSAILTAFNVDLYKSLKPDSDLSSGTEALLRQVALLNNGSPAVILITSTNTSSMRPSTSSVWINGLWFTALVLSLSSAFIGLVARQWINQFSSPTSANGKRSVYMHCLRWDKGIIAWHVPTILAMLPILLQLSVALFLAGLLVLIWTLNETIAIVMTALVSILAVFWAISIIAPVFNSYCPYKSPQCLIFRRIMLSTSRWIGTMACRMFLYVLIGSDIDFGPLEIPGISTTRRWSIHLRRLFSKYIRAILQIPHKDWASLEGSLLCAIEGNRHRNKNMDEIKDKALAYSHEVLMDDELLNDVILDGLVARKEVANTEERTQLILRRLRAIFESKKPLSLAIRESLVKEAYEVLKGCPLSQLLGDSQEEIWAIICHIESSGEKAVSSLLRHFSQLQYDNDAQSNDLVLRFIKASRSADSSLIARPIWIETIEAGKCPATLSDVDPGYLAYVISSVVANFVPPTVLPSAVASNAVALHARITGLNFAMRATSIWNSPLQFSLWPVRTVFGVLQFIAERKGHLFWIERMIYLFDDDFPTYIQAHALAVYLAYALPRQYVREHLLEEVRKLCEHLDILQRQAGSNMWYLAFMSCKSAEDLLRSLDAEAGGPADPGKEGANLAGAGQGGADA